MRPAQPMLLLVDDNADDRAALRELLRRAGCEARVVEQPGAAAALAWLHRQRIASDTALLIIVDLDGDPAAAAAGRPLPGGADFLEAFAELRLRRPDLQPCVVTVLSSACNADDLQRTRSLPFVWRHFVKMPAVDALRDLLRQAALCSTDAYEAIL